MKDSFLKLQDKTIVIAGPSLGVTQSLATLLFEQGADVALIGEGAGPLRKFAEGLMDQRQIHSHFGRIVAFEGELNTPNSRNDVLTRVVETLGSLDGLIDAHHLMSLRPEELERETSSELAELSLKFLRGRQKGRIVFLFADPVVHEGEHSNFDDLDNAPTMKWLKSTATSHVDQNITMNAVLLGSTEEQIKKRFPKLTIQEGLSQLQSSFSRVRLLEGAEVAPLLAFLLSPLSQSLTGQLIRANKGA